MARYKEAAIRRAENEKLYVKGDGSLHHFFDFRQISRAKEIDSQEMYEDWFQDQRDTPMDGWEHLIEWAEKEDMRPEEKQKLLTFLRSELKKEQENYNVEEY